MTCGVPPEKGRLRDECLNVSWFRTRGDVQRTLANWREAYHCERPTARSDIGRLLSSGKR